MVEARERLKRMNKRLAWISLAFLAALSGLSASAQNAAQQGY